MNLGNASIPVALAQVIRNQYRMSAQETCWTSMLERRNIYVAASEQAQSSGYPQTQIPLYLTVKLSSS